MATGIVPQVSEDATDFVPETFGRLTTLDAGYQVDFGKFKKKCHMVRCICGTVKQVMRGTLLSGKTKSCGCLHKETSAQNGRKSQTTHGHASGKCSPVYLAYRAMISRCYNPSNKDYHNYGGRGIGVWDTWRGPGGFELWFTEIGPIPTPGMTQDRFPNRDGNYEPGNVRWATVEQQQNNKRNNRYITYNGELKTLSQWSRTVGIHISVLHYRLGAGWSIDRVLATPVRKRGPNKPKI